jgi:two-component system, cell cycle sensor histidine kinase and response regulator CckA
MLQTPQGNLVATGQPFFEWLVTELVSSIDFAYVHIGEVTGEAWDRIQVLAGRRRGIRLVPAEFELRGTPCESALSSACEIHDDVCARYPHDAALVREGARAYCGVPIRDIAGHPLGLVSAWHDDFVADFSAFRRVIERAHDRLVGELEIRAALRERAALIEGTTMPSSTSVFDSLASTVARTLRVKVALVCELLQDDERAFLPLGVVIDGRSATPTRVELGGCPSNDVYNSAAELSITSGVRQRYPNHPLLESWNAEAYIGVPFTDSAGLVIGHVAIIHDKPIHDRPSIHELLRMVAIRAGFELERHRATEGRVEIERKMLEAQRLESLGLLAGGVAHDFNNLLVGILGNASLAQSELEPTSPVQHYLTAIELAGRQAADLARQMLAYSGRGRLEIRTLDVHELISETLQLLQRSISRRVAVAVDLHATTRNVAGDASQIRQVVMNLTLNAAEAIGDASGRVAVSTRSVELRDAEVRDHAGAHSLLRGSYFVIEVRDTGCGMDSDTLARIFDPFFTTKFTGRGLGLAAVHGIVRSHAGAITVDSEPGAGTCFRVYLPIATRELPPRVALPGEARGHSRPRSGSILVVDDEPLVRATASRMVQHLGYEFVLADDCDTAIASFRERGDEIRAVLLDMTMPGRDGVATLRELRRIDPTVKVILMTGFDERDSLAKFDHDPPSAFLGKPFQLAELRLRLDEAVERTRASDS